LDRFCDNNHGPTNNNENNDVNDTNNLFLLHFFLLYEEKDFYFDIQCSLNGYNNGCPINNQEDDDFINDRFLLYNTKKKKISIYYLFLIW